MRGVNTPDPALWDTAPSKPSKHDFFTPDRLDNATFRTEEFDGTDSYMGQYSDDDDSDDSPESAHPMMINNPHVVGHFEKGNRPSDTCPHTCVILNQNVNGLVGKDADDKLENIIEMMITRNIHRYCLQETRKIGSSIICIINHTIFHHGIESQPNAQGRNSAGVVGKKLSGYKRGRPPSSAPQNQTSNSTWKPTSST